MACGLRDWSREMHVLQPTAQIASFQRLTRGPEITMKYAVEAIAANSALTQIDPLSMSSTGLPHEASGPNAGSPSSINSGGGGLSSGGQKEERFSKTNIYLRGLRETDTDETLKEMVAHVVGADNIKSSRAIIDSRDDAPGSNTSGCRADPQDSSPRRKVARTRSPPKEGYGFIDFKSEEIALQALEYLKTNEQLKAERPNLEVKFARDNEKDPTNIYLQGMPLSFRNDKDLEEIFKTRIGGVSSARVMIERRSNDPTGVAFVRFSTPTEAQRAIDAVNSGDITIEGVRLEAKLADRHNPDERRRRSRHGNSRSGTAQNGLSLTNSFLNQAQYLNYIASNQLASYPAYYQAAASVNANRLGFHLAAAPSPAASLQAAPVSAASATSFGPAIAYSLNSQGLLQQQLAAASSQLALTASASASNHPQAFFAAQLPSSSTLGSNSDLTAATNYQNLLLHQNYATGSTDHSAAAAAAAAAAAYAQTAAYAPFTVMSQEQQKM